MLVLTPQLIPVNVQTLHKPYPKIRAHNQGELTIHSSTGEVTEKLHKVIGNIILVYSTRDKTHFATFRFKDKMSDYVLVHFTLTA